MARCLCKISYSHMYNLHTYCQLPVNSYGNIGWHYQKRNNARKLARRHSQFTNVHIPHVSSCERFSLIFWPIYAKSICFVGIFGLRMKFKRSKAYSQMNIIRVMCYANSKFIWYLNSFIAFLFYKYCNLRNF